jgi:pimeloyl-ACP methyl ester carboxylesterase
MDKALLEGFPPAPPNIDVMPGEMACKELWYRRLWMGVTAPWQALVVSTLFNMVVPRAWQNLLRRTEAMFRTPREFDPKVETEGYVPPVGSKYSPQEGALAKFLHALGKTIVDHPSLGIELDVIAHSMGAMIVNEIVRTAPDLPYRNLVYMAPACSIRRFAEAVTPILGDQVRTPPVHAWVLTLNPKVEALQEDWGRLLTPIGSVLEWLEGFLTPPSSYLDRFLGKWDNALSSLHIFEDAVRPRLHVKGFPYDPRKRVMPWRHVQFNDKHTQFWRKRYWTVHRRDAESS